MSISATTKQIQQRKEFSLSDFYKKDVWDLTRHPQYIYLTEKQKQFVSKRKHIVDFTSCFNKEIVNEIKCFLAI